MNREWYQTLQRPPLTPPDRVFGVVWTILYVMIAVALLFWILKGEKTDPAKTYALIAVHLILNALWTPVFFGMKNPAGALVVIFFLCLSLGWMLWIFWKEYPPAFWLLLPYAAWALFATYLNLGFWVLNRGGG
ncbi:MAG: tryptophan-rich sensory protein [Verrucomicrobia bacterium]|nr:tryptophan-rich sensory protein [Verrucomicrobiota bacterium]MCH8514308.1 tryptophan-rich sensory protein [Kiritimatiellia bacterium]